MNTNRKEAVEDALRRGHTAKEAFEIAINTPDYSLADLWGPDDFRPPEKSGWQRSNSCIC